MAPIGTTLLTLVTTQVFLSQVTVGHYPHFFPWAKHWKSKEDSSSSSSSSESKESSLPKKECDAWVKQTLDSLHAQVSYLEKKLGTDCRPEALSALCPPGYYYLVGRCYKFSVDKQTWDKARFNCTWDGGDLVAIETPVEEEALDKFITSSKGYKSCKFYTLGNDQEYKGFWLWGTGKSAAAMIYKNWAEGEPNDHGGRRESCVEYYPKHGWNDVVCNSQLRYICERPPGYNQDAFSRKNVTDTVKSSEESDSSHSSKESSSKSNSAEKHRSYGKRSKDLDYKHGGPPPWWFHHHGRFHHHHPHHGPHHHGPHHHRGFMKPWHFWHHKHKGSFLSRGHGAHEKHYHGSGGHYSKHKTYRYHGYRGKKDSDEDQSKSKSSSEKNRTKLKPKDSSEESHSKERKDKKKDKSSQESSSGENKSRGYYNKYQHYKPWFQHKPWHYGRHYKYHGSHSSESSSKEKKQFAKGGKSSGKSSEERHISLMYSLLRRVVHGFSDLSVHKALHQYHQGSSGHQPFPVLPVPQQLYPPPYIFIPVTGLAERSNSTESTYTTHHQGGSVDSNDNDTLINSTSADMNMTGQVGNTGNMTEANDTVSDTSRDQWSKYKGIYVYSYLPPHRPQRIFYPGLPPPILRRPLYGNPNTAGVQLRWGYYYGGKGKGEDTGTDRGGMTNEYQVDSVQVRPPPVHDVSTERVSPMETPTDTTGVSSAPTSDTVFSTDTTSTTVSSTPVP